VTKVEVMPDRRHVMAHIHIDDAAEADLKTGTQFYLEDTAPSLADLSSLKSVISGPAIVMVPGRGTRTDRFTGRTGNPPLAMAHSVRYLVRFKGDVGTLKDGAPVTLRGFPVGEIVGVRLAADLQTGSLSAPVVIALDPARFHIAGAAGLTPKAAMTGLLAKLVARGLRAQLSLDPPLIGNPQVTLAMTDNAPSAQLATTGAYPEIPTSENAGISAFIAKVGRLPIDRIGANVRSITDHIDRLVSSPQLKDSIAHLDRTLAQLDKTMRQAGPQVAPAIADLRKAAGEIDATAAEARKLVGGNAAAPNGNLQQSLRELTDAARAVRSLADYLDRHPEALIQGR
jgi:paraquat-inducible protein B